MKIVTILGAMAVLTTPSMAEAQTAVPATAPAATKQPMTAAQWREAMAQLDQMRAGMAEMYAQSQKERAQADKDREEAAKARADTAEMVKQINIALERLNLPPLPSPSTVTFATAAALRKEMKDQKDALLKYQAAARAAQQAKSDAKEDPFPAAPHDNDAGLPRPGKMPACDAREIAAYMLAMHDKRFQKKESSWTEREHTNTGVNAFVYNCLGLLSASDYENTANLSAQLAASKGTDQIGLTLTQTFRALKRVDKGEENEAEYTPTYVSLSLGGFGHTGSGGDAPLIDLTTSNFASGVGVVAGIEWGRMPGRKESETESAIRSGIAKARQDCVEHYSIDDPLTESDDAVGPLRMAPDPIARCSGDNFAKWLIDHDHANQYWQSIVSPLWGFSKTPRLFAGAEFRYAFQDVSYRPVIDPKTGAVTTTTLPDVVKIHPEPFSLKAYGGISRETNAGDRHSVTAEFTGSLSYRREIDFIDGTSGKTICTPAAPGATFETCNADQKLAAPYDTKGFVAGLELNLKSQHFWYLPPIGISPRLTYAFDTKRLGIEVPLILLNDGDGKPGGGLSYTCRFRGTTPEGFELKKSCGINLFVGTSFDLRGTP